MASWSGVAASLLISSIARSLDLVGVPRPDLSIDLSRRHLLEPKTEVGMRPITEPSILPRLDGGPRPDILPSSSNWTLSWSVGSKPSRRAPQDSHHKLTS